MSKAVILFSGGLDSSTVLACAKSQGFECYPISFHYGQKHSAELAAARRIAEKEALTHHIIELAPSMFGRSALTDESITVEDAAYLSPEEKIPNTYVPARNTIFLAIALGFAENIGAFDIFIGASHVDYSGYPDCRPEFIHAFQHLANLATKAGVEQDAPYRIHAPLMYLSKAETIKLGISLGIDYHLTVSCYRADPATGAACGCCDSCSLRKKGFMDAGISDPTLYSEAYQR